MNLFRILISGYYWAMAVHYCSKGKHEKASRYLSKNEELSLSDKLHRHYIHTFLLHAHVKKSLGKHQESLDYALQAKELLRITDKIAQNDIGYLQFYATVISLKATEVLGINEECIEATGEEYVMSKVSKKYLDIFILEKTG
jgi:hypothetical protein